MENGGDLTFSSGAEPATFGGGPFIAFTPYPGGLGGFALFAVRRPWTACLSRSSTSSRNTAFPAALWAVVGARGPRGPWVTFSGRFILRLRAGVVECCWGVDSGGGNCSLLDA